jgi:hypothetical protein
MTDYLTGMSGKKYQDMNSTEASPAQKAAGAKGKQRANFLTSNVTEARETRRESLSGRRKSFALRRWRRC